MACFIVPAAEAIVTTITQKVVEKSEGKTPEKEVKHIRFSEKLGWLNRMLWGGSALLAFEHVWHGEVIPTFPFLTAVQNGETEEMLAEMGTAGVGMAVLVTIVWAAMAGLSSVIEKRGVQKEAAEEVHS
ncbi:MAG: hypothetical protein K5697_00595 [Lachnospiraceae bacterium]|nr:hypothetical protein [Lachnospiraceae bacterium]